MRKELSLEEKIGLCVGEDFWRTRAVPECGIPTIETSDGPHGLRKQSDEADCLGLNESVKAVCFPTASCLAASFDREAAYEMGRLLGEEARAEGVQLLLGPALNVKRSPLCGRNFEYFSEDPYLTGEMAAAVVKGIQSTGVGACVKHFAANNQENYRMVVSAEIDERTLREIYLRGFERVVAEKPRAVMSSYNRVNGTYVGESKRLLTDILRGEWGFDGIVISDWYAVADRVRALLAGLDLEMPGGSDASIRALAEAAKQSEEVRSALSVSAERIAKTARALSVGRTKAYDKEAHHKSAVELACESAVLLKNDGVFPLRKDEKILCIGKSAVIPRFQGGGSSHINAYRAESAAQRLGADYFEFDNTNQSRREFRERAEKYDKILVFLELSNEAESEGYDRAGLELPAEADALIDAAADCGKPVAAALFCGAPVTMPWLHRVNGLFYMGLCGEGVGEACALLFTGEVNPSGRLAESFPLCIEHTPAYLASKGIRSVRYAEGVFVGYRYYTTKNLPVLFPFGYGLSYTRFAYSDMTIDARGENVFVSVAVENVGNLRGKETVQLYVSPPEDGTVDRPIAELKGFDKISLEVGEKKTVRFTLNKRDFCYYDGDMGEWRAEGGEYRIVFGRSCQEEILSDSVRIAGDGNAVTIDDNVTVGELMRFAPTAELICGLVKGYTSASDSEAIGNEMKRAMLFNAPLRLVKRMARLDEDAYRRLKDKLKELAGQKKQEENVCERG